MKTVFQTLFFFIGVCLAVSEVNAARSGTYSYQSDIMTKGLDCLAVAKVLIGPNVTPSTVSCAPDAAGVQSQIKACPSGQTCAINIGVSGNGNGPYSTSLTIFGGCSAGASAGRFTAPGGYTRVSDGEVVQNFPEPAPFGYMGCMVEPAGNYDCFTKAEDGEVAPGIKLAYCTQDFKETGETGGASAQPAQDVLPYDPGGGTDPGGGGTDPGGGGTDPGGGGTDPGDGGTDPGDGSGDGTADLCSKHPGLNICKNSSWSGSCGSIVCNGDAIQCETLRMAALARCERQEELDILGRMKERLLGEKILAGADPDKDNLPSKANADQVDLPTLDKSGWLGGGSCFADKTFSVMGSSVTLPFSQVCGALLALRYALMVSALLISFKVLSGAILRD